MRDYNRDTLSKLIHSILYDWMVKKIKQKRTNPILKFILILLYILGRVLVLSIFAILAYYAIKENILLGILFIVIDIVLLILFINTARIEFFKGK